MIYAECIHKVTKGNKIISYVLQDATGRKAELSSERLKAAIRDGSIVVINLSLTKDNRLVSKSINHFKDDGSHGIFNFNMTGLYGFRSGVPASKKNDIIIPEWVSTINHKAFYGDTDICKVLIPGKCKTIGAKAFSGCVNLKEVIIENGVECILREAFNSCISLERIVIPGSIKSLPMGVFGLCSRLKEVVICSGVEKIESMAFCWCDNLIEMTIPKTLRQDTLVGTASPFNGCNKLSIVHTDENDIEALKKRINFETTKGIPYNNIRFTHTDKLSNFRKN